MIDVFKVLRPDDLAGYNNKGRGRTAGLRAGSVIFLTGERNELKIMTSLLYDCTYIGKIN